MGKDLKQNKIEKPKVIIEPEIFVGEKKSRALFTDSEYSALLKYYQSIMFDRYLEEIKSIP
ncbi:hypothetical protein [Alkalihalobacillus deserti]|uniref:hypothetical protein n=1 Tax=Alkalihalobacillus deserti TaxID=2879466 RepID=UPI001D153855|nr:hypothetical protein [Alkalihalobacillus deserti]